MTANRQRNLYRKLPKQRMRPWLINLIDSCSIPGLVWIDKGQKIFRIPWKHGSRQNWRQEDANLFILWAQHRGKYLPGDIKTPNTKKFKATFRCALNSLPDCEEIVKDSQKSGHDAFKIYKFNECVRKKKTCKFPPKEDSDESMSNDAFIPDERLLPDHSDSSSNDAIPRLDELFGDSFRTPFPNGGIYYLENVTSDETAPERTITASEIFGKIENYTEDYLIEETTLPYSHEIIIQNL